MPHLLQRGHIEKNPIFSKSFEHALHEVPPHIGGFSQPLIKPFLELISIQRILDFQMSKISTKAPFGKLNWQVHKYSFLFHKTSYRQTYIVLVSEITTLILGTSALPEKEKSFK